MKKWYRKGYLIKEVEFDGDLHHFVVYSNDKTLATITPDTLRGMNCIIDDLNAGEDIDGWLDSTFQAMIYHSKGERK